MTLEKRYRSLLRWYPATWRASNEEVVLGTLMVAAEAQRRTTPTRSETASIALHGLGSRLDRPTALWFAAAGTAAAIAGGVVSLLFMQQLAQQGLGWLGSTLTTGLAPAFLSISLAAVLRSTGLLGPLRALLFAVLGALASVGALATLLAWSAGFDAADEGLPQSAFAQSFWWIAALAVACGMTAVAVLLASVLSRLRMHRSAGWAIGLAVGAVAAPALGLSLLTPLLSVAAGLGILLPLLISRTSAPVDVVRVTPVRSTAAPRRVETALAWSSIVLGLAAVAFALSGSWWFDHGLDGTESMRVGVSAGHLAAIPLVAALAVARGRVSAFPLRGAYSPAAVLSASLVIAASAFALGQFGEVFWALLLVSVFVSGVAVALVTFALVGGSTRVRAALAVAGGAGYAVAVGVFVTASIPFAAPVAGILFVILGRRRMKRHTPVRLPAPA